MQLSPSPLPSIRFVVHTMPTGTELCLNMPIEDIDARCHRPTKYIRFLGWAILGVYGHISRNPGGEVEVLDNEALEADQTYYYISSGKTFDSIGLLNKTLMPDQLVDATFRTAVDISIVDRSRVASTTATRDRGSFYEAVVARDSRTQISSYGPHTVAQACHIIPFAKGDGVNSFCLPPVISMIDS